MNSIVEEYPDPLEVRVGQLAERLRNRRRLVVRDSAADRGELRRLEVLWTAGDGRTVPALPWVSSEVPAELGVARLLSAVEQSRPLVGAPLRLRPFGPGRGKGPTLCFAYPGMRTALRVIWRKRVDGTIGMGRPSQSSEPDASCVELPTGLEGADFVQLEALDSMEWGAGEFSSVIGQNGYRATALEKTPENGPGREQQ